MNAEAPETTSEPASADMQRAGPGQPEAFTFTGSGSEYFRIWIVNLLLTIVTLGIYSAWAKVRRTRYFYANTRLAGSSFDYHGSPLAILRGRIVALLLFGAYNIAFRVSDAAGFAMLLVLGALIPWMLWKSLQFKLYNSSYRGIRFGFGGSAGKAYFVYLVLPVLSALSLLLLVPFTHQRIKKFQHDHSRYGATSFSFHAAPGRFYKAYLVASAVGLGGMLAIMLAFGGALAGLAEAGGLRGAGPAAVGTLILFLLVLYAWIFSFLPVFFTLLQNLIWNNTRLGEHRFESRLRAGRMIFIALTNLIGIVVTLGLFIPFAQVRTLKYRIESMSLIPSGSLDAFLADAQQQASATGEGAADLLDVDLSL
ncbi:MAG TPA: YjgN family protein [Noviherbaspirillum sp.]|uniref:YjgN family protein n=1 Tax=Noviherbaspirillum sp. TaxID=1926288 RepID=UPI002D269E51|nr:YjgN family protein [Noviherbaspirillum sp.]HYD97148.1 YjgN family protein [Noviherbaspirillum sp.]